MKLKTLIITSAVAIVAATSANAADIIQTPEPTPVVAAPMFSWQGFYAGAQIGGRWADTDVKAHRRDYAYNKSFSPDPSGFMGGVYAGYNFDLGNSVVLGVEQDFTWADIDDSSSTHYTVNNINSINMRGKVKENWAGATRARIGYAVDRWLPYFAAGVAYADIDSSVRTTINNIPNAGLSKRGSDTLVGYTLGAGADYAMTDNVILRAEYRFSDYGDESYSNSVSKYKVDYKTNDVRVGVAYKF